MEIPNILLQVAARWDGESKPAVNAASVILPDFSSGYSSFLFFPAQDNAAELSPRSP